MVVFSNSISSSWLIEKEPVFKIGILGEAFLRENEKLNLFSPFYRQCGCTEKVF